MLTFGINSHHFWRKPGPDQHHPYSQAWQGSIMLIIAWWDFFFKHNAITKYGVIEWSSRKSFWVCCMHEIKFVIEYWAFLIPGYVGETHLSLLPLPWCRLAQCLFWWLWVVKKMEKWFCPHAAVPALHLIMALGFFSMHVNVTHPKLPKYPPQSSSFCCKKGRKEEEGFDLFKPSFEFSFCNWLGKRPKLKCHFCPFIGQLSD